MASTIYAFLAKRIREERTRQGLTLEQLAASADISTGFLAYIEKNRKKPSLITIDRIASALKLTLSDLFKDTPSRRSQEENILQQVAAVLREASPRKREMMWRVLKTMAKAD